MCRWFSIFVLPYVVYIISAQEQEENNSLTRPIHPRRHKRAEQVRPPVVSRSPFVAWKSDPKCMIAGRDLMSCPKKNADDPHEKLICIEPQALCDDHQDCHGAEDEEPHFCMFKKLEDAEMRRIKAEILVLVQNNRKQPQQFRDVIVNNDVTADTGIKQSSRPGIFKIKGSGPLGMYQGSQYDDDVNKSVEDSEDEDENEEEEEEEEEEEQEKEQEQEERKRKAQAEAAASQHAKRRRTYRHLLQLKAANL